MTIQQTPLLVLRFLIVISLIWGSCSSIKQSSKSEAISSEKKTVRLFFFSRGSGIDGKTKKEFTEFERAFRKENNISQTPIITQKGKEGEISFCYDLSGWEKKKAEDFILKSAEIMGKSKLVRTEKNVSCGE